jgi:hypothetical protein
MVTGLRALNHKNYTANALLHARKDLGDELDYIEVEWERFYADMYGDLQLLRRKGVDVETDIRDFTESLSAQTAEFQARVSRALPADNVAAIGYLYARTKDAIRPTYRNIINTSLARTVRQRYGDPFFTYVGGRESDFGEILGCARMLDLQWLDRHITPRVPTV